MTDQRKTLGNWGEQRASNYLIAQGYTILERSWRCRAGEIDLIALNNDTLVCVEVRTRHGTRRGSAEESITPHKAERMLKLAGLYLQSREEQGDAWQGNVRIDVIAITLDQHGTVQSLNHLESAVEG